MCLVSNEACCCNQLYHAVAGCRPVLCLELSSLDVSAGKNHKHVVVRAGLTEIFVRTSE